MSSFIFEKLFDLFELVARFSTYPYWFFRFASAAFRSHSFRRPLALKYNTTSPAFCQHFFASFLSFFYISQKECFRAGSAPSLKRCFPYLYYKRRKSPAVDLTAGDCVFFLLFLFHLMQGQSYCHSKHGQHRDQTNGHGTKHIIICICRGDQYLRQRRNGKTLEDNSSEVFFVL